VFRDHWPTRPRLPARRASARARPRGFAKTPRSPPTKRLLTEAEAARPYRDEQSLGGARRAYYEGFVDEAIAAYLASAEIIEVTGLPHAGLISLYADPAAGWQPRSRSRDTTSLGGDRCKTSRGGGRDGVRQAARELDGLRLVALGPGTADFIHTVTECRQARRSPTGEAWYGDPISLTLTVKAPVSPDTPIWERRRPGGGRRRRPR